MEFVPTIGAWVTGLAAVLMAIVGGSATFPELGNLSVVLLVAVIWSVMVNIQAIFIAPRIVGESLGLHPVAVILAVIWGGTIGGLAGVILAPAIVATLRVLLQYVYGRLTGQEAFSPPTEGKENIFNRMFKRYMGNLSQ